MVHNGTDKRRYLVKKQVYIAMQVKVGFVVTIRVSASIKL